MDLEYHKNREKSIIRYIKSYNQYFKSNLNIFIKSD